MATQTEQASTALEQAAEEARSAMDTIHAARLACDWLEARFPDGNDLNNEARALLREHGWPDENREAVAASIRNEMRDMPIEIAVRSNWRPVGKVLRPTEFFILLSTGGPATRITGRLDKAGEPADRLLLEYQHWFTPWTPCEDIIYAEDQSLEWFCQLFVFDTGRDD